MINNIENAIKSSIEVKANVINDKVLLENIVGAVEIITKAIQNGGKVLFCGNGGSAADAQHLAAELVSKFYFDRPAFAAIALTTNTSIITAISNDYDYSRIFARQIEAIAKEGDILVGISTSGNSENVLQAVSAAKAKNMMVIGMTGKTGGKMRDVCDVLLNMPSNETPRIQEAHITIGHIICEYAERALISGETKQ
jgi:D-sedoheptulose 7-phosphate isomerase